MVTYARAAAEFSERPEDAATGGATAYPDGDATADGTSEDTGGEVGEAWGGTAARFAPQ
jgi:hypothetical protein